MANRIFQWLYIKIFKRIIRCKNACSMDDHYKRFVFQYYFAKLFGGAKQVMAGDSDCDIFGQFSYMKRFKKITLMYGVPGSTPRMWLDWFKTQHGKRILEILQSTESIWDIGGNCLLQGTMDDLLDSTVQLHSLFANSWCMTAPPINDKLLGEITKSMGRDVSYYHNGVLRVNAVLKSTWGGMFTIDVHAMFSDPVTEDAKLPIFYDGLVHYNPFAIDIIMKVLVTI